MSQKSQATKSGGIAHPVHNDLKEVYIKLYRLLIHLTDYGKIEGGTLQSRTLIDEVNRLGELAGVRFEDIKDEL